jgi:hypothetical protein
MRYRKSSGVRKRMKGPPREVAEDPLPARPTGAPSRPLGYLTNSPKEDSDDAD